MGLPKGWSSCDYSVTESSRWLQRMRFELLSLLSENRK